VTTIIFQIHYLPPCAAPQPWYYANRSQSYGHELTWISVCPCSENTRRTVHRARERQERQKYRKMRVLAVRGYTATLFEGNSLPLLFMETQGRLSR
jgi:hypothetical protein